MKKHSLSASSTKFAETLTVPVLQESDNIYSGSQCEIKRIKVVQVSSHTTFTMDVSGKVVPHAIEATRGSTPYGQQARFRRLQQSVVADFLV